MISIHLFGKFEMECNHQPLSAVPGGKAQELLCYLLLHNGQAYSREVLAALLWPDCEAAKSKKNLRQILWQLRSALAPVLKKHQSRVFLKNAAFVQLQQGIVLSVDASVFQSAYDNTQGIPGERLDRSKAAALHEAVLSYRGDLLEGCYEGWCLMERERLQNCYLSMLDKLVSYWQKEGDYQCAIDYAERIVKVDHASERAHQQLMRLHHRNGDRTAALRQYERCRLALEKELGVAPSRQTTQLYQEICADQPSQLDQLPPETSPAQPYQVLFQLRRLMEVLGNVKTEVEKSIQSATQRSHLAEKSHGPSAQRTAAGRAS